MDAVYFVIVDVYFCSLFDEEQDTQVRNYELTFFPRSLHDLNIIFLLRFLSVSAHWTIYKSVNSLWWSSKSIHIRIREGEILDMASMFLILTLCVLIISLIWGLKFLNKIWWRPKRIEKQLKKQGIHGYPYRLLHGNTKEMMKLAKENRSNPVGSTHDIMPRVNPLLHELAISYSKCLLYLMFFLKTKQTNQ